MKNTDLSQKYFISHKTEDREIINEYLSILENNKIDYWIQDDIQNNWPRDIDEALEQCRGVIYFMTKKSYVGTIYAEISKAEVKNKLFVVKLDDSRLPYHFRAETCEINYFMFIYKNTNRYEIDLNRFEKTFTYFSPNKQKTLNNNDIEKIPKQSSPKHRINRNNFYYHIALCFFEYHNVNDFLDAAEEIKYIYLQNNGTAFQEKYTVSFDEELSSIVIDLGAEIVEYEDQLKLKNKYIKYTESTVGYENLEYLFGENLLYRKILLQWINHKARSDNSERNVSLLSDGIALLCKNNFLEIYNTILEKWLYSSSYTLKNLADEIISKSVKNNEEIFNHIARELIKKETNDELLPNENDSITSSAIDVTQDENTASRPLQNLEKQALSISIKSKRNQNSIEKIDVALFLACGQTGLKMPEMAINVFSYIQKTLYTLQSEGETSGNIIRLVNILFKKCIDRVEKLCENINFQYNNRLASNEKIEIINEYNKGFMKIIENELSNNIELSEYKIPILSKVLVLTFLNNFSLFKNQKNKFYLTEKNISKINSLLISEILEATLDTDKNHKEVVNLAYEILKRWLDEYHLIKIDKIDETHIYANELLIDIKKTFKKESTKNIFTDISNNSKLNKL